MENHKILKDIQIINKVGKIINNLKFLIIQNFYDVHLLKITPSFKKWAWILKENIDMKAYIYTCTNFAYMYLFCEK